MIDLSIAWLLPDGAAGGFGPDGAVVVPGALPGDLVRARIVATKGRTAHAELVEILTPSPARRAPPCPWSDRCGGCDLDALTPQAQRQAKAAMLQRALRLPEPPEVVPSPRETGYRARIKLNIRDGDLGFFAARTHTLVPIDACGIARPELQPALAAARDAIQRCGGLGLVDVELRTDGTRVAFAFSTDGSALPDASRSAIEALGNVALDGRALAGDPTLCLHVDGLALRASPRAFYQVNLEQNERMVAWVADRVAEVRPERTLDLYAGIGNFSLPIARATGAPVLAVESEGQAIEDLRHSAATLGLGELVRTLALPVEKLDPSREPFDVALLDPPRAGAPGIVPRLLHNRPRRIVYVACFAPSAARDLRAALDAGYSVTAARGFDLFPDTHHVEVAVVLDRGTGATRARGSQGPAGGSSRDKARRGGRRR